MTQMSGRHRNDDMHDPIEVALLDLQGRTAIAAGWSRGAGDDGYPVPSVGEHFEQDMPAVLGVVSEILRLAEQVPARHPAREGLLLARLRVVKALGVIE